MSSPTTTAKTLLLVRHAKSSWKNPELDDIDRPLNKRGRRDAPDMGRRLHERPVTIDLIVTSPAVRARTTAEVIAEAVDYFGEVVIHEDLYGAAPRDVLEIICSFPEELGTIMVVGHNPTMTDLANRFADSPIDNVPTCGVLTVEVSSWQDAHRGRLLDFDFPKNV